MADTSESITQLVSDIVVSLVDVPEAVEISSQEDGSSLRIDIKVAEEDTGKIIGRQGRIIKAIRILARAASSCNGGGYVEVEVAG